MNIKLFILTLSLVTFPGQWIFALDACSSQGPTPKCMEFMHEQSPFPSFAEAAAMCRGGVTESCVQFMHEQSPYPSFVEAATLCKGGVTTDCVKFLHEQSPFPSYLEAARLCKGSDL